MKIFVVIVFILISLQTQAQENISGEYQSYVGNWLRLNSDSTFLYKWRYHLSSSWTKGQWKFKNDTIYFNTIPVYDTLVVALLENNGKSNDIYGTQVLSFDEKSDKINYNQYLENQKLQAINNQNYRPMPKKVLYQKGKLYLFDEKGKPIKKRFKGINAKKYGTWFYRKEGK